mmetsp:Transcript_12787/g.38700  ORF Transcript_12787/g.38700 Transcript_12787/m.38700 type:complete len:448 (-) Transcript_12787:19-1362(-)
MEGWKRVHLWRPRSVVQHLAAAAAAAAVASSDSASSASIASGGDEHVTGGSAKIHDGLHSICENPAALKSALRAHKLSTLKELETRIGELSAVLTEYPPFEGQTHRPSTPELQALHTQACLLERAEDTLTPLERVIQRKQRRRWRDLQTKARAQERKRVKQAAAADDERMLVDDPDRWGMVMQARRNQLFNDLQTAEANSAGLGVTGAPMVGAQSNKRHSAKQHRRMRAMASAIRQQTGERSKRREAHFGANDDDWDVYRDMTADTSRDSERDADAQAQKRQKLRKEITRIDKLLQRYSCLLTDQVADYQISIGLEAARCTEMLFQPSMMGIDQQGLGELVPNVLKRCPPHLQAQLATRIFVCGGVSQIDGLPERLYASVRQERPCDEPVKLWSVPQVSTAPWRGAARWVRQATVSGLQSVSCSRAFYEESGGDRVVAHWASNEDVL